MDIKVEVVCRMCKKRQTITCNEEQFVEWQNGELIQNALKDLSVEDRELLISETCSTCFDKLYPLSER